MMTPEQKKAIEGKIAADLVKIMLDVHMEAYSNHELGSPTHEDSELYRRFAFRMREYLMKQISERDEEVERLKKENEELKYHLEFWKGEAHKLKEQKLKNGDLVCDVINQSLELDTLKKQVESMRTEREFELAYCFGLLASEGITVDKIAELTKQERWAKIKEEIKKYREPLYITDKQ